MKKVMGKVITVVVIIGILFGIYFLLPEYPKNCVKATVQKMVDKDAQARIEAVKQKQYEGVDNQTFDAILTKGTTSGCYTYTSALKSDDGAEHVYYYGKGASINLKDWPDYGGGLLYTDAVIKVDFKIKAGNNLEIVPYIDDLSPAGALQINDGKHTDANNKIKADYFNQLYNGVKKSN